MKLFAPKYYRDFSCIADRCKHSCCLGWEIDIDSETMERYSLLDGENGYGKEILRSIDTEDTPHFRLCENERCPHLDERGLCRIITELGEDCLCEICREHPRFYNDSANGKEAGLGMACEEACRIILESDEYRMIEEIGELCGDSLVPSLDTTAEREKIYEQLACDLLSHKEKLACIYSMYMISPSIIEDGKWHEIISSLEYMDEAHRELFMKYSSDTDTPRELEAAAERALAYFVYRHCTEADDMDEYRASLGFCLFCERLFVSVLKSDSKLTGERIIHAARIISEELEYSEDNTERIKNALY